MDCTKQKSPWRKAGSKGQVWLKLSCKNVKLFLRKPFPIVQTKMK